MDMHTYMDLKGRLSCFIWGVLSVCAVREHVIA